MTEKNDSDAKNQNKAIKWLVTTLESLQKSIDEWINGWTDLLTAKKIKFFHLMCLYKYSHSSCFVVDCVGHIFNLCPPLFLSWKCFFLLLWLPYILKCISLCMYSRKQMLGLPSNCFKSDLGPYCLQSCLFMNMSRWEAQMIKIRVFGAVG